MATRLNDEMIGATLANPNLVVRNLQVTMGYYRLSRGMRRLIGDRNVSWVGMATYASKTAGQAIRHELMPKRLKSTLIRAAGYDATHMFIREELMAAATADASDDLSPEASSRLAEALRQVSLLVSEGNVMVYAELANPFLDLVEGHTRQWDRDDAAFEAFLTARLRPGPVEADGQDLLREAFGAYYDARFETDHKRKAEHVFHGNLLVGLHEQTRLQPYIEQALAAPLHVLRGGGGAASDDGLMLRLAKKWGTKMMMSLTFPNRELKLGQDVIAPTGVIRFPPDLLPLVKGGVYPTRHFLLEVIPRLMKVMLDRA